MSTVMDHIINLLFTLLQIVANDKVISHIVIMIGLRALNTTCLGFEDESNKEGSVKWLGSLVGTVLAR